MHWMAFQNPKGGFLRDSGRPSWSRVCLASKVIFSSVQSLSRVQLFAAPWTAACQASLLVTNSQSLLKFMYIESVMPSNHLIVCHPLLLLPSIFPSIRVLSNESVLCIRRPKYWSHLQALVTPCPPLRRSHLGASQGFTVES